MQHVILDCILDPLSAPPSTKRAKGHSLFVKSPTAQGVESSALYSQMTVTLKRIFCMVIALSLKFWGVVLEE